MSDEADHEDRRDMRGYNRPPWPPGKGGREEGTPASEMRASDAERRMIADALSQHFADGRLDQSEFDERMEKALGAKTRGDLDGLLRDLPPVADQAAQPPAPRRGRSRATVLLVGALALVVSANFWNWAWRWHGWGWGWRPHLGFPVLLVLGLILLSRRRGWRRCSQERNRLL